MIVFNRKKLERIILTVPPSAHAQTIAVQVCRVLGGAAVIGVEAAREIQVDRQEVHERKAREAA